jgi:transposase
LAPLRFGWCVHGGDNRTGELFSYVDLEVRVRRDHLQRAIRTVVNEALSALQRELAAIYSPIGRPSIPPEKLLRARLLQCFILARPKLKKLPSRRSLLGR